jgi:hypothetical protein
MVDRGVGQRAGGPEADGDGAVVRGGEALHQRANASSIGGGDRRAAEALGALGHRRIEHRQHLASVRCVLTLSSPSSRGLLCASLLCGLVHGNAERHESTYVYSFFIPHFALWSVGAIFLPFSCADKN